VIEEEDKKMADENGEETAVPMNMSMPNPNGVEFDNLYLDMNGIVNSSSQLFCSKIDPFILRFTPVHIQRARYVVYAQHLEVKG
jgi:hypothetical protein